ncbi:MAG TPA: M20/M25/M40 family metallo-hydrolase [Terriglobia bacterium]|nr:M20/M25/M40 family metallo-hydrolase [Terriglobia bacterium]
MRRRTLNFGLMAAGVVAATLSIFGASPDPVKKPKAAPAVEATTAAAASKPEIPDLEFLTRLREEEFSHGKVMDIMSHLTDDIGPRLTGSPNMRKANEWTRDQLTEWGLANAHLEPWGKFGRGWAYQMCEVRMISPDAMQFLALPEAWTPGTNGPVRGEVVEVTAASSADLDKYRGKLAGKIVLMGEARVPEPIEKPLFHREDDSDLARIAAYEIPAGGPGGPNPARRQEFIKRFQFQQELSKFWSDEHVAAVLEVTRQPGQDGTIFVQSGGSYEAGKTETVPKITLAVEHFGRMARLLAKKVPVEVEVNVEAQFYDNDDQAYDTIAEIPGTDPALKEQLVMLGGHMDSWHAGEGATDNGAGVAVAMEAVRLLKQLGAQPRRTIRIALWSGEEEGLLGSRGYVKNHFGSRPENTDPKLKNLPAFMRPPGGPLELKPEQTLVSVYFNLDNGTGRVRGVYLQGNAAVEPIFEKWMEPFHDLGMTTLTLRNTGGTDHLSFDAVGIPGFQFIQDSMDYGTLTHHSNLDVYEHIRPQDLKQASVIMAAFVYNAAMRDEMMPRKPMRPDEPPAKSESEGGGEKKGEAAPPAASPAAPAANPSPLTPAAAPQPPPSAD